MKVLVTGNLGYIGSVLTDILLEKKINFIGYDIGYFKKCNLVKTNIDFRQIIKDIRDIEKNDLENSDCIVHLSALSNDPLGEFDAKITNDINYVATMKLATIAKESGVKRFVYISSQSMYGISSTDDELDEYNSDKKPVTEYAKTKWKAELELNKLNSKDFTVVSFRPSTVYGVSPRLRCDIVFNNLVASAYTTGKIEIMSDGSPWRPVVHVRDVCSAILAGLHAPTELISGKAFNVGIANGNYTVKDLAEVVHKTIPNSRLVFTGKHLKDARTYKVSFKKILTELKNYYKPQWNLEKGALELLNFFKKINFKETQFKGVYTNRLRCLSHLISNMKIDNKLKLTKNISS
jgi:nucleoside-diphosphate-sugar epimerase